MRRQLSYLRANFDGYTETDLVYLACASQQGPSLPDGTVVLAATKVILQLWILGQD